MWWPQLPIGWLHFRGLGYGLQRLLALTEITTLGEWGLLVLTMLLGIAALHRRRRLPASLQG